MSDKISKEELSKRVKFSQLNEDRLYTVLPKGTKERLLKYTDNISKYVRDLILKDLEKKDKVKDK